MFNNNEYFHHRCAQCDHNQLDRWQLQTAPRDEISRCNQGLNILCETKGTSPYKTNVCPFSAETMHRNFQRVARAQLLVFDE